MQTTDNYELKLMDGGDIVNPLTIDRPNYVKIDEVMYANETASVGLATELVSATIHNITRQNPDQAFFRFIATANAKAGHTYTVDGVTVSALTPSGETLTDNAYVINANVICCLTGSLLTFYLGGAGDVVAVDSAKLGGELPAYYAKQSDLTQVSTIATSASSSAVANTQALAGVKFGVDADGNYGYIKVGADSVTPFKSFRSQDINGSGGSGAPEATISWALDRNIFPDYQSLTIDDFFIQTTLYQSLNANYGNWSYAYNADTGTLSGTNSASSTYYWNIHIACIK